MSDQVHDSPANGTSYSTLLLPVTVAVPWCQLTLSQLNQWVVGQHLQPGHVKIGEVILSLNGCCIARGQLLQLQGHWAVRVHAIEP